MMAAKSFRVHCGSKKIFEFIVDVPAEEKFDPVIDGGAVGRRASREDL
jgi:hypothetical protein